MINEKQANRFCCDNISLIENYNEAQQDVNETWDCHHKLGLFANIQWLIDNGFYYDQRAEMLIFLKHSEHIALHQNGVHTRFKKGHIISDEEKIKIIAKLKGRKCSDETKNKLIKSHSYRTKKVLQYTIDGVFVREWSSLGEIKRTLRIKTSDISTCCHGKQKTAHGFVWRFAE